MRARLKRGLARLLLLIPDALVTRLGRLWLTHASADRVRNLGGSLHTAWLERLAIQEPRPALIDLLHAGDEITERVNQLAIRLDGGVHAKHRLMRYHDFFVARIRPGERVLDVGCGYGAVAYSIASRAQASVVGIDLSESNIDKAGRLHAHPSIRYVVGDATNALPDERFAVVVLSNVLEHIDDRQGFLRRLLAAVHPGRLLVRVPMSDRHWLVPLRRELGMTYMSDPEHFTEYTVPGFLDEMQRAGLTVTHHQVNWGEIWAECQTEGCSGLGCRP